ncbi:tetratricopeptide repeat protein [Streptomyces sp. NPDC058653]|uniref:tetratricopeptide repeat protein n=1 Tax=Streptomyces sp. NPDC058653 TaxID=3346576 RepID=UPI00364BC186
MSHSPRHPTSPRPFATPTARGAPAGPPHASSPPPPTPPSPHTPRRLHHHPQPADNLADTLNDLGRHHEAADLHQQTLATFEQVLGPNNPNTLTSRNNLAAAQAALARTRQQRLPWQRPQCRPDPDPSRAGGPR